MLSGGIVAVVTELSREDPASADRVVLAGIVERSERVRSWLDALDARVARRADELAACGVCEPAPTMLRGGGRRSARDAAAVARRGEVCDVLPAVGAALADGDLAAGHADAVARAANHLSSQGGDVVGRGLRPGHGQGG